jgi:hypothetical protein
MFKNFDDWWTRVGSGMFPVSGEDSEIHAHRVAKAAVDALVFQHPAVQMEVMPVNEALEFADEWSRGLTVYQGKQGWRVVCMVLADAVRRLRRGEFICTKCGLRKDAENPPRGDF